MICECGNSIKKSANFCNECGRPILVENKKFNLKPIYFFVIVFFLISVSLTFAKIFIDMSTVEISELDISNYPFVTFVMKNNNGSNHTDLDFKFYQDEKLVTNIENLGRGKFIVFLNGELSRGDRTYIKIKKSFSVYDANFRIRQSHIDYIFLNSF